MLETLNLYLSNESDAAFRAWGSAISGAIAAVGLTKTSDTGQVNWTTVTADTSGASNVYPAYEMWNFTDTIQGTAPTLIKIQYGHTDGTFQNPGMSVQIGIQTDGAGNFVSNTSEQFCWSLNAYSLAFTSLAIVSGDTNRLAIAMRVTNSGLYSATTSGMFMSVERDKDTTGSDTTLGSFILFNATQGTNNNYRQQFIPRFGVGDQQASTYLQYSTGNQATGVYGGNVGLFPIYPFLGYILNPAMGGLIYFPGDFTDNTEISVNVYGGTHSYWICNQNRFPSRNSETLAIAIRYE